MRALWPACLRKPGFCGTIGAMKIATFNVNNVNKRLDHLLAWLAEAEPDIVCLQETKCSNGSFPSAVLRDAGYGAIWHGLGGFNGVAILGRGTDPIETRRALPGDVSDRQPRYLEAAVHGVIVASIYLPNGNPQPGPKFDYKLAWFERLIIHAGTLLDTRLPVVLAGDFNVAASDDDIYPTRSYRDNALVHSHSRAAFARLLDQGWTDVAQALHPDAHAYTFWDYRRNRWQRDAGLRLDYVLVSPGLVGGLQGAGVDKALRGHAGASDHAPVWVEIDGRALDGASS